MALGQYHAGMEKKPQDTPSRHADKYIVRFPEGMRDKIAAAAEENGRSMNAEIIARLQASFETKTAAIEPAPARAEWRQIVIEEMENYLPLDKLVKFLEGTIPRANDDKQASKPEDTATRKPRRIVRKVTKPE